MSKTSIGSKIQSDERVSIFRYEITNAKIRIIIIIRIEADNTIDRDKFNIHISRYSTENRVTWIVARREIDFWFLSNYKEYDRTYSFIFEYEPNAIPFGS